MKYIIDQKLLARSEPSQSDCCLLSNIFSEAFPEAYFLVLPRIENGVMYVYADKWNGVFELVSLTPEQNYLGLEYDAGLVVRGKEVEITERQIAEIKQIIKRFNK